MNRIIVAIIVHNEYKNDFLNKKYLRYLMNRIQSKDQKTRTYEMNKISLSCFDNKIHIQNKRLPLGY